MMSPLYNVHVVLVHFPSLLLLTSSYGKTASGILGILIRHFNGISLKLHVMLGFGIRTLVKTERMMKTQSLPNAHYG